MHYIAFILFLAATFWLWDTVSTVAALRVEERVYYAKASQSDLDLEGRMMQKNRITRLADATRSALLSAAFLTGSFYLPFRKYRKHLPFRRRAPHPVDLTNLVNNVKNHPIPSASRIGAPHFFASRRARCRAARSKLAAKMISIFHHSPDVPSLPDNP